MSHYKDFLKELPKRSLTLLNDYYEQEKLKNNSYEVTFLISIAMPVFVITSEFINEKLNKEKEISEIYKELNNSPKNNSKILSGISKKWLWSLDTTKKPLLEIELSSYETPVIESNQKDLSILRQIRNALAHGGIKFTQGVNNDIAQILFRSEKREDNKLVAYYINLIPVNDFKLLLINWCNFLKNNDINVCLNMISNAA